MEVSAVALCPTRDEADFSNLTIVVTRPGVSSFQDRVCASYSTPAFKSRRAPALIDTF